MREQKFYLEFGSYPSPDEGLAQTYAKMTLHDLLEQADKDIKVTVTGEGEDAEETIDLSHAGVLYELYRRLDVVDGDTVKALIKDAIEPLAKRLEDLERKYRNHRHNLEKTYSEKPVDG